MVLLFFEQSQFINTKTVSSMSNGIFIKFLNQSAPLIANSGVINSYSIVDLMIVYLADFQSNCTTNKGVHT